MLKMVGNNQFSSLHEEQRSKRIGWVWLILIIALCIVLFSSAGLVYMRPVHQISTQDEIPAIDTIERSIHDMEQPYEYRW
jgi:hypothetical protein